MQEKPFNRYFILIWFSMLCLMLIQNLMYSDIPLFFAGRDSFASFVGLLGLPFTLFGILVRTTGGYLMDWFGHRVIMILDPLLVGTAPLPFLLLPSAPLVFLFRGLRGTSLSIGQTGSSTATVDVAPQKKSSLGVDVFWVSIALAIVVAGWLIEILGSGSTYDHISHFSFVFGVLGIILVFLCWYEKGGSPVVREPQEINPFHGLREFLYPAVARSAAAEFFVMLRVSCCNIFIFTYAVLRGYISPGFLVVIAALSMIVSNLVSGWLLRALSHRTLLSIVMALSRALIALIVLIPCRVILYLDGIGFDVTQSFSFLILALLAVDGVPQNHCGTTSSTMLMVGDLGIGFGTLLWGISIQFYGFYVSIALSGLAVAPSGMLSPLFYCRYRP